MTKSYKLKVMDHTPGALKCHEIDANGEKTTDVQGAAYFRKSSLGDLPVGTVISVTLTFDSRS